MRIGNLTHTWVGDLKLELTSPTGTIVVLADRPGGTANSGHNFTGTVFDDEASVAIGAASTAAPYTGSFRPQADQLSRFDGESQQGTWTLKVSDLAGVDTGNLNAWGLDSATGVCDFAPPPPPGQPTGLAATAGSDSVALDWDDTPAATKYEIHRRGPGGTYAADPTATTTSSAFTDTGRTPGQEYCYKVGALNDASPGPLSEERCAAPPLPPSLGPPGGPPGGSPPEILTLDLSGLPRSIRVRRNRSFVLRFLAAAGRTGSLKLDDGQAGGRRAQAAQAGSREEVLHRPGQWPGTGSGQAGPQGHARVETNTAAARDREGHARDAHGNATGHPARSASPAAALSRVPSA